MLTSKNHNMNLYFYYDFGKYMYFFFLQDVILDIIWTVWFLPYLEYLEVDGIVPHVNPLDLSVIILLNVQGKNNKYINIF